MNKQNNGVPPPPKVSPRVPVESPPVVGKQLFSLGAIYATPAVIAHLAKSGAKPAALLAFHRGGEWGVIDEEDRNANCEAIRSGDCIASMFIIDGESICVITDTADANGVRAETVMLFARED